MIFRNKHFLRGAVALTSLSAGCGDDSSSPRPMKSADAAMQNDAGGALLDAARPRMDAGVSSRDAGSASDAGSGTWEISSELVAAIRDACEKLAACGTIDDAEYCTEYYVEYYSFFLEEYSNACMRSYAELLSCVYSAECSTLADTDAYQNHVQSNCADEAEALDIHCGPSEVK